MMHYRSSVVTLGNARDIYYAPWEVRWTWRNWPQLKRLCKFSRGNLISLLARAKQITGCIQSHLVFTLLWQFYDPFLSTVPLRWLVHKLSSFQHQPHQILISLLLLVSTIMDRRCCCWMEPAASPSREEQNYNNVGVLLSQCNQHGGQPVSCCCNLIIYHLSWFLAGWSQFIHRSRHPFHPSAWNRIPKTGE